ncbi:NACHT, LRR and PYD domains-containing protein 3-like isoform X2 [Pseudorasbora parva]|uniref:NACHT, LRR and PYD domains-containing protein 3-like isoform X2 n=1 Tax=Pseudorasbora parva TaxID=51549 RepID=UPI00351E3E6A
MSLNEEMETRDTAASPEASCVSMKSNTSIVMPPNISNEAVTSDPRLKNQKATSPEASCVSMKSNTSIIMPPNISNEALTSDPRLKNQKAASPEASCVSMKSNTSIVIPPNISNEAVTSDPRLKNQKATSPEASCVSMKSNTSIVMPPNISNEAVTSDPRLKNQKATSPEASCVSMKSNTSIVMPPNISNEAVTSDPRLKNQKATSSEPGCVKSNTSIVMPPNITDESVTSDPRYSSTERKSLIQVQSRCGVSEQVLKDLVSITCKHSLYWDQSRPSEDFDCPQRSKRYRVMTGSSSDSAHSYTPTAMQEETGDLQKPVDDEQQRVKDRHKTSMKNKYERLFEGIKLQENQAFLNKIYTKLYIIEGEREGLNEEHEVLQMEKTARTQHSQDTPIDCNDIFKASPEPGCEEKGQIKTVLTKGIAGIGKTVSVQKFILDWAEGRANQDVDFMFVLPFREMNLIRDHQYSLHRLLLDFYPELRDLDSKIYECKVVFIFDGLDESRITLMFSDGQKVSDLTDTSSVGVLMSNLIKGELLPSALIWITSRPAAANQIPSKYINRLTEIQGFNEPQREEYFRKRISDEHQASRIISHIRRARSLHIMCHIPVFCWISSTVLQKLLEEDLSSEIPRTLTEMYIHFLLIQINMRNQKYEERDPEKLREGIVKLAEVAFKQLMKGNVMFYEEDLKESGIDVTDAAVYSGICTEIFKEESVIYQRKVYSFIHLSIQEFLAAFYVFYHYVMKNVDTLQFIDVMHNLLRGAVDKALESENGQLDLFLRFLLGISLESNQRLLQDLLTHTENSSESIRRTTQYIKEKIKDGHELSTERSINLFLCLLEVKDQTLSKEIQEFVKSDKHSEKKLSPAHCSTIAYMLQMSEEVLDELDLKKYNTSDEGRRRLIPAVINCTKALLAGCNLTAQHCEIVSSALQSSNSLLRELDLSNNDLQDSAVKLLSDGLKSPNCQLQILRLSGCMVTEEGCGYVSLALSSNPSHLRELDLSYNHPGDYGVKLLSNKLKDPNYELQILNVDHGEHFRITQGPRKYACNLTLDPNTVNSQLMLSEENRKVTHMTEQQPYPDHPERFDTYPQVLCGQSLTGRCYWEVEWTGRVTGLAVTYKGISRKGVGDCVFGWNDKSWSLFCSDNSYIVCHNNDRTDLIAPLPPTSRVGVYVDVSAGTLSFYSVSDTHTLTHLHTFNTTFTEPLYAGFRVYDASVSLRNI